MTDKESSAVYKQLDNYIEVIKKIGGNIEAEPDHGAGFETPELRQDFIEYIETFHSKLSIEYNKLKNILTNIK